MSKSYVYVIGNGQNKIKIGVTSSAPESRLKELQTGSSSKLTLLYKIEFAERGHSFAFERATHKYLEASGKRVRSDGEWFNISPQEAVYLFEYVEAVNGLMVVADPTQAYYMANPEDRTSSVITNSTSTNKQKTTQTKKTTPRKRTNKRTTNTSPRRQRKITNKKGPASFFKGFIDAYNKFK